MAAEKAGGEREPRGREKWWAAAPAALANSTAA